MASTQDSAGQVLSGATIAAGDFVTVSSGGQAADATVLGYLIVDSGGAASGTLLDGGYLEIFSGGDVYGPPVASGFQEVFSGAAATGTTVGYGGFDEVLGGVDTNAVVTSGGFFSLQSGVASGNTIVPGAYVIASGGLLSNIVGPGTIQLTPGAISAPIGPGKTTIVTGSNSAQPDAGPAAMQIPTGRGYFYLETTSTGAQAALAQQVLALAAAMPPSQTVLTLNQPAQAIALSATTLIDLPSGIDTITGNASVPLGEVLLANANATYVTGGTVVSIVVAVDGAPVTIVNNRPGDALVAATGAAGNTLEGLEGANQCITGIGGQDAVLLHGAANSLASNGSDVVLVGGPSTVAAASGGLDNILMTSGTLLAFINQSTGQMADSVTGAANGVVLLAGGGNTAITAAAGAESFFADTSAGNATLNGSLGGVDAFTFIKNATAGTANAVVTNFVPNDIVAVHGYAGFTVQASAATQGAAVLALSDGSWVTFTNTTVATVQATVRVE